MSGGGRARPPSTGPAPPRGALVEVEQGQQPDRGGQTRTDQVELGVLEPGQGAGAAAGHVVGHAGGSDLADVRAGLRQDEVGHAAGVGDLDHRGAHRRQPVGRRGDDDARDEPGVAAEQVAGGGPPALGQRLVVDDDQQRGPDQPAAGRRALEPVARARRLEPGLDHGRRQLGVVRQQPTGAGGVAGVGQPLGPVPVGRRLDAGEHHHRQVGRPVEGGRLAHERAGDRQRRRPVPHDADDAASRQVERHRAAGQRRRLVEQGGERLGGVCGLQRTARSRGAPGHVADTGAEVQEIGVAGPALPQRHARQLDAAHDLGRIGVGERSPAALVVGRRPQPVGQLGQLAGEPLALAPLDRRPLRLASTAPAMPMTGVSPANSRNWALPMTRYITPAKISGVITPMSDSGTLPWPVFGDSGREMSGGGTGRAGRGGRLNGMVPAGPVCRRGS